MNDETEKYLIRHLEDLEDKEQEKENYITQLKAFNKALSESIHSKNVECDTQFDLITQVTNIIADSCTNIAYDQKPTVVIMPEMADRLCTLLGIDMEKEADANDKVSKDV